MTYSAKLYQSFKRWVEVEVSPKFPNYKFGIADQQVENIAWLRLSTRGTISGIKLWSTGDYYCEILTFDKEEPDMVISDNLSTDPDFSVVFSRFLNRVVEIDQHLS